jgi:hypothetical protein
MAFAVSDPEAEFVTAEAIDVGDGRRILVNAAAFRDSAGVKGLGHGESVHSAMPSAFLMGVSSRRFRSMPSFLNAANDSGKRA